MMKDVIALTPDMPDASAVVAGLFAGGPGLDVGAGHDGAVIQLRAADGRPLVSLEAPLLVHVPGEAERLLGGDVSEPPVPYWWTEVRASTAVPEAGALAGSVAGRLTALLGGSVWPAGAATTEVVRTAEGTAQAATDDDDALTVDVLTDSTAVVLADRPLLVLTAWLSAILRKVTDAGLALHIVTPPHVRLSLPLRTALAGAPNRWVVQDPECGYYDGLSGAVLHWQNGTFTPVVDETGERSAAKVFTENAPATGRQLGVAFRVTHRPDDSLVLGRALETAWSALTGATPAGWGTAEPINLRWSKGQLTNLARERSPEPTHLLAVGHPDRPAIATHRVTRAPDGVAEDITLTLGYGEDETPPLDAIEALARTLVAEHGLTSMLVTLRRARRDLAVPPSLEAPPIPVSFTLGAEDVHTIGLDHARRPPVDLQPVPLGPTTRPALYYPLGDGTDAQAWTVLQRLHAHLRNEPAD
ncbi:DUF6177 family protein [Streptomyces syringium]|uniref:DUF6177 family protein n=1 Tax=Streptomyces syringium TaxID=76729 RepID=UPI0033E9E2F0